MNQELSFLVVDTDLTVVRILKEQISKHFPESKMLISEDGDNALSQIRQHRPDIVITGLTSSGMNSMELCHEIRKSEDISDTYVIVLTNNPDKIYRVRILDEGANDYLVKPLTQEDILSTLKTSLRFIDLKYRFQEENKLLVELADELENNINEMTQFGVRLIQSRVPVPYESMKRMADTAVSVASQIGEIDSEELKDIETAAYLCYSGRLFLPDYLIKAPVMINGMSSNNLMYQIPVAARDIVGSVSRYKDVAEILYHVYENFDGSGFPGRLQSWQIPLGSRILRVILDYEEMRFITGYSAKEALEMLRRGEKRLYDFKIIVHFEQYIAVHTHDDSDAKESIVHLQDLKEGMIVSRDIITYAGLKLLPEGAVLRDHSIQKLLSHNASDPIIGNIIIRA